MEFDLDTISSFLKVTVPGILTTFMLYRVVSAHSRAMPQGKEIPCNVWHRLMQGALGNKFSIIGCWGGSLSGSVMVFHMATAGGVAADYLLRRWQGNAPAPYPRTFQEADSMHKCSIAATAVFTGLTISTLYVAVALASGLLVTDAFIRLAYSMETYTDFIGQTFIIATLHKNGCIAQGAPLAGMLYGNILAMQFVLMTPFFVNGILYSTNWTVVTSRAALHFGSLTNAGIIKMIFFSTFGALFFSLLLFGMAYANGEMDLHNITLGNHALVIALSAILIFIVPGLLITAITSTAILVHRWRGKLPVPLLK